MRVMTWAMVWALPLCCQNVQTPLWIRVSPLVPHQFEGAQAEPLRESELKSLLKPTLTAAGFRIADAQEALDPTHGLVLEISAVDLELNANLHGMDLELSLSKAPGPASPKGEAQILEDSFGAIATSDLLNRASTRRETLIRVAALLSRRIGRPLTAEPLPEAPAPPPASAWVLDATTVQVESRPKPPAYPDMARLAGVQGDVAVEVTIDPAGHPRQVTSRGPRLLRTPVELYAMDWQFHPTLRDGKPMWTRYTITVPFKIAGMSPR